MICLSQLFPIFLWKDFLNSSHVFYGNGMNFLYPLGFFFLIVSQLFPIFLGDEFFLVCKITKNMPKSFHLNYGKNNHYGLILNLQAMTVIALLTKYS